MQEAPVTRTSFRLCLSVALAASLLMLQPSAGFAFGADKNTRPVRDFLPPVATINPRIDQTATEDNDVEPVEMVHVASPTPLHLKPKVTQLRGDIDGAVKSAQAETVMGIQKQIDTADLNHLWEATVERNPVIRFSLEKLAQPTDLQPTHSSQFLRKGLATLITGATLAGSYFAPTGGYERMGMNAAGQALRNMAEGNTQPNMENFSETEKIQMAGLVDELKQKLMINYQDYRNALQALAQSHEVTIRNNNMYSKALASKNDLAIMASGTAYYQALEKETELKQKAKLYRLALERLAGPDAVSDLALAPKLPDSDTTASNSPVAPMAMPLDTAPAPEPNETVGPQPQPIGPEQPGPQSRKPGVKPASQAVRPAAKVPAAAVPIKPKAAVSQSASKPSAPVTAAQTAPRTAATRPTTKAATQTAAKPATGKVMMAKTQTHAPSLDPFDMPAPMEIGPDLRPDTASADNQDTSAMDTLPVSYHPAARPKRISQPPKDFEPDGNPAPLEILK